MKIGVTGATGFIGSRVGDFVLERGHSLVVFSRRAASLKSDRAEIRPIPETGLPDLSGLDAIVNLAGESIFGLWTAGKKQRVLQSRVSLTRRLVEAMEKDKPAVLINASAVGYYGDTGETLADESSPAGSGFLSEVCQAWEAEAVAAEKFGVRVARVRFGMVLGKGGALKIVRPLFRLGLGGNLGDGRQWMSSIHVDDAAGLILWALENSGVDGPLNAVMPEPFRNETFTRELARAVHRPAFLPAPAFVLRLALGEMSHMLLDNSRVVPARPTSLGYKFRFPDLPAALRNAIS